MSRPCDLIDLIGSGIRAFRTPPTHVREGGERNFRHTCQIIDLRVPRLGGSMHPRLSWNNRD